MCRVETQKFSKKSNKKREQNNTTKLCKYAKSKQKYTRNLKEKNKGGRLIKMLNNKKIKLAKQQ